MEIIKADTIEQYNNFFGFETRHPLVGVVHFDRSEKPTKNVKLHFRSIEGKLAPAQSAFSLA